MDNKYILDATISDLKCAFLSREAIEVWKQAIREVLAETYATRPGYPLPDGLTGNAPETIAGKAERLGWQKHPCSIGQRALPPLDCEGVQVRVNGKWTSARKGKSSV